MGDLRIVAGRWGRRRLKAPAGRAVRPTPERVRDAWMSVLGAELDGADVLDLFAGSGALGLEALSRGAARVTLVERSRQALRCMRDNVVALGVEDRVTVVAANALSYVEGLEARAFDLALADPPYGRGLAAQLVERYRRRPFARVLSVEHEADERLPLPPDAEVRRYGDTAVAFILADSEEERA